VNVCRRVSTALMPPYDTIGQGARTASVNDMDETSGLVHGDQPWLWGMATPAVAYCHIPPPAPRRRWCSAWPTGGASWCVSSLLFVQRGDTSSQLDPPGRVSTGRPYPVITYEKMNLVTVRCSRLAMR
jgi:hypothetical protein